MEKIEISQIIKGNFVIMKQRPWISGKIRLAYF